jgi:hypothetical protein
VEFPLHDTLPLGPTLAVQTELPVQSTLHELPQEPAQAVWFEHDSVQLPPSPPQLAALNPQLVPELQEQVEPLQVAGATVELELPQAARHRTRAKMRISQFSPTLHKGEVIPEREETRAFVPDVTRIELRHL